MSQPPSAPTSGQPGEPGQPEQSGAPGQPAEPGQPVSPGQPAGPGQSGPPLWGDPSAGFPAPQPGSPGGQPGPANPPGQPGQPGFPAAAPGFPANAPGYPPGQPSFGGGPGAPAPQGPSFGAPPQGAFGAAQSAPFGVPPQGPPFGAPPPKKKGALPWVFGGIAILLVLCLAGGIIGGIVYVNNDDKDAKPSASPSASASASPSTPPNQTGRTYKTTEKVCELIDTEKMKDLAPNTIASPAPLNRPSTGGGNACGRVLLAKADNSKVLLSAILWLDTTPEAATARFARLRTEMRSSVLKAKDPKDEGDVEGVGTKGYSYVFPSPDKYQEFRMISVDGNMVIMFSILADKGDWTKPVLDEHGGPMIRGMYDQLVA